jgi:hypothetical protein
MTTHFEDQECPACAMFQATFSEIDQHLTANGLTQEKMQQIEARAPLLIWKARRMRNQMMDLFDENHDTFKRPEAQKMFTSFFIEEMKDAWMQVVTA